MLWMAVTPDELELPIAVEDNPRMLARKMHTTTNNIFTKKYRKSNGKVCGYKVITVSEK